MLQIERNTAETEVRLALDLHSGKPECLISTSVGFLDHMLTLLGHHAQWVLKVSAQGDSAVDDHHLVEDVGILLGKALREAAAAIGTIGRYASLTLPMDGSLVLVSVDVSGRGGAYLDLPFPTQKCGSFDTELVAEFWKALAREGGITLHLRTLAVDNSHHLAEATFKGVGRALKDACTATQAPPSTKGVLL